MARFSITMSRIRSSTAAREASKRIALRYRAAAMSAQAPTLAVVQARMTSSRLPGKSMADVVGEPMLALLLKRLARSHEIDGITVATSVDPSDDPIAACAERLRHRVERGPL